MKNKSVKVKNNASRLRVLFAVMALALLIGAVTSFLAGAGAIQSKDRVQRYDDILEQIQDTFSTIKDAETAQRGYLLTRNEQYLDPYWSAVSNIRQHLKGLKALADQGELPRPSVDKIDDLVEQKLAELDQTVDLIRAGQNEQAVQIIQGNLGKQRMDTIRGQIFTLKTNEEDLRSRAELASAASIQIRAVIFIVVYLVNLAFLFWIYRLLLSVITRQYVAALETQRQKEILSVTLASIGDGVIITDTNTLITFLNPVAEELTGWTAAEALGQPCAKIFHVVSDSSREPVENPVDKILKSGRIISLSNLPTLIRKDGSEIPIDDSGAPIREADGNIRGVVLVFRDFTVHKEVETTLITAKNEIEASSKAKDQFLATLSHELRTPLTPILATLLSWEEKPEFSTQTRTEIQLVRRNVELQARLIDDLLDLTHIAHGKLSLALEPVNAQDVIEDVAAMFRPECLARQIRLQCSAEAERPVVPADAGRLHQILWNIVGNAVKFSSQGDRIEISARNTPQGELQIAVTDTGLGISPGTLARLFDRFEQGTLPKKWKSRGLGLGLSIAKALAEAQGGNLEAASAGLNQGSTFTLTLPHAQPPEKLPKPATADAVPPPNLRLLLLEDHEDTAAVLRRVLISMGHTVEACSTIRSALEKVRAQPFDLILSDLGLPDGTGLDFIRHVRETCSTPAVALTGYGMAEDVERCLRAGFDAHLTKPVDFDKLRKALLQAVHHPV